MSPLEPHQGVDPGDQVLDWLGCPAMPDLFFLDCRSVPEKTGLQCSWHQLDLPCAESWCLPGYSMACYPACATADCNAELYKHLIVLSCPSK